MALAAAPDRVRDQSERRSGNQSEPVWNRLGTGPSAGPDITPSAGLEQARDRSENPSQNPQ